MSLLSTVGYSQNLAADGHEARSGADLHPPCPGPGIPGSRLYPGPGSKLYPGPGSKLYPLHPPSRGPSYTRVPGIPGFRIYLYPGRRYAVWRPATSWFRNTGIAHTRNTFENCGPTTVSFHTGGPAISVEIAFAEKMNRAPGFPTDFRPNGGPRDPRNRNRLENNTS